MVVLCGRHTYQRRATMVAARHGTTTTTLLTRHTTLPGSGTRLHHATPLHDTTLHARTHTRTRTHARTHTHAHARTHTRTHTHTSSARPRPLSTNFATSRRFCFGIRRASCRRWLCGAVARPHGDSMDSTAIGGPPHHQRSSSDVLDSAGSDVLNIASYVPTRVIRCVAERTG